jgi:hypothetical protein
MWIGRVVRENIPEETLKNRVDRAMRAREAFIQRAHDLPFVSGQFLHRH